MTFVVLFCPNDSPVERQMFGTSPFVVAKGPRHPFKCVMLADDQQTGLFARAALPAGRPSETEGQSNG
jgi:hypothetical protein